MKAVRYSNESAPFSLAELARLLNPSRSIRTKAVPSIRMSGQISDLFRFCVFYYGFSLCGGESEQSSTVR